MRKGTCALLFLSAWIGTSAWSQQHSAISETRDILSRWVETRQLIARTQGDWDAQKDMIQQSIAMFERELKTLDSQFSSLLTSHEQAGREREQLMREKEALTAGIDRVKSLLVSLEAQVRAISRMFPEPLLTKVDPLLKRIPEDAAATRMSAPERMQNLIGILNEAEKFNGSITVSAEVQKNSRGEEMQVKVLYLGLGQAYFVENGLERAGVGVPTAEGWKWTGRPELAARVQQAIAVYESSQPASFVALPVQIQ